MISGRLCPKCENRCRKTHAKLSGPIESKDWFWWCDTCKEEVVEGEYFIEGVALECGVPDEMGDIYEADGIDASNLTLDPNDLKDFKRPIKTYEASKMELWVDGVKVGFCENPTFTEINEEIHVLQKIQLLKGIDFILTNITLTRGEVVSEDE